MSEEVNEQNAIEITLDTPVEWGSNCDRVRLLAIGAPEVVAVLIHTLHKRGFAEVDAWGKLLPERHSGKLMSVYTWSIRLRE